MGMESQATELLGEAVSRTAVVSPKGQGKKFMTAGVAGQLAGVAGAMMADAKAGKRPPTTPGDFSGGYMVIGLGETQIAFFEMKRGLMKNGVGKLLVAHPRESVTRFDIGGGTLTAVVTVELADGTNYLLEVPRAQKGGAEKLAKELGLGK